jgi:hypothetical protein
MAIEAGNVWKRKFDNPWREMLQKKNQLTLPEIVQALRGGAEIDALTPDIRSAIEEAHRSLLQSGR